LEVADADGAFFGAAEYGDDAPEGGRSLEEGEEVGDEPDAGVVGYCRGVVEVFRGV
jgi:hypothetical protein